jgi:hypothetical protein
VKWYRNKYWGLTDGPDYSHPKYTAQTPTCTYKIFFVQDEIEIWIHEKELMQTKIFPLPLIEDEYLLANVETLIMESIL